MQRNINIKMKARVIVYVNNYTSLYVYEQLMLFLFMGLSKDIRKNKFYYMRSITTHVIPFYKFNPCVLGFEN